MPRKPKTPQVTLEQYEHAGKERLNAPPMGLVTETSESSTVPSKAYQYDPHLDPQLQWAGKAERTSFEVPTVSLHVHERIDPRTIIESALRQDAGPVQASFFETFRRPLRQAFEFYQHREGWSNRLVAGDSLLVMNSLLEKEGLGGQVQMIYLDPPYGIKYGSNFQPFVNKRDVKDGKDEDLTAEPEQIRAFRDTWELGIHSYLTYLRDRLLLARELLTESGSIFVQISDVNLHHVRELMDEVFGAGRFVAVIRFFTRSNTQSVDEPIADNVLWYAKNRDLLRVRPLYVEKGAKTLDVRYRYAESPDGQIRSMSRDELEGVVPLGTGWRRFSISMLSSKSGGPPSYFPYEYQGKRYYPQDGRFWSTTKQGIDNIVRANRIFLEGKNLKYKLFLDDFRFTSLSNTWTDTVRIYESNIFVVQTGTRVLERCILMTTDPGDLVLDPTCGSGTTAFVAERWGRRWITCDTSRVAVTLAKQRLMTALYDYYELAHPHEGVGSGFVYKTVPHITLKSIANNEPAEQETLYDQPRVDNQKKRVSGPFTVEAVPAPRARSLEEMAAGEGAGGQAAARSGETLRQAEWRAELLRAGVRAKAGKMIKFSRVEPLAGTIWIQAEAETQEDQPRKALVVFGPEHAPLGSRTVENAWQEARLLRPHILLFCAFQFDEQAAREIDEMRPGVAGMQFLKAQMNADLFTEDLRKKHQTNESFWLIGQPDVEVRKIASGEHQGKYQAEVHGFDYYNPATGNVESGGKDDIATWLLDTDYDGRSLFPSQVFFPLAGPGEGWDRLARSLRAELDEESMEAFRGTVSLPFAKGSNGRIALKIVDNRGIESLRVIAL